MKGRTVRERNDDFNDYNDRTRHSGYSSGVGGHSVYGYTVPTRRIERRGYVNSRRDFGDSGSRTGDLINTKWLTYRIGVIILSAGGTFTGLYIFFTELTRNAN